MENTWTEIEPSTFSMKCTNINDQINKELFCNNSDHQKKPLRFYAADPCAYGTLQPHPAVKISTKKAIMNPIHSGYTHTCGLKEVRQFLAKIHSSPDYQIPFQNVILSHGGTLALSEVARALCSSGDNILLPTPSHGQLMSTVISYDIIPKLYKLLPRQDWEIDLEDMEKHIDERTRLIYVMNPSNPTGAVYSRDHLVNILSIAEKYKLPILSDESYGNMTFSNVNYIGLSEIETDVPIIKFNSLSRYWLAPGWRLAWLIFYDRLGIMENVIHGVQLLQQIFLHAPNFLQAALPEIIENTPTDYMKNEVMPFIQKNHDFIYASLQNFSEFFEPIKAKGTIHMMILLHLEAFDDQDIKDEHEFCKKLQLEENVYLWPSSAFCKFPGGFSIITCNMFESYVEAIGRISDFCYRHEKRSKFQEKI